MPNDPPACMTDRQPPVDRPKSQMSLLDTYILRVRAERLPTRPATASAFVDSRMASFLQVRRFPRWNCTVSTKGRRPPFNPGGECRHCLTASIDAPRAARLSGDLTDSIRPVPSTVAKRRIRSPCVDRLICKGSAARLVAVALLQCPINETGFEIRYASSSSSSRNHGDRGNFPQTTGE